MSDLVNNGRVVKVLPVSISGYSNVREPAVYLFSFCYLQIFMMTNHVHNSKMKIIYNDNTDV